MRNRFPEKLLFLLLFLLAFSDGPVAQTRATQTPDPARSKPLTQQLVSAAIERTHHVVRYDPAYVRIAYPDSDVPADTGVCTDEIIRIYRAVGIDLQKEVHEDMQENFSSYPNKARWRLADTDTNIDHRRVPNLMVFFGHRGQKLPLSSGAQDYSPGDIVVWDLGGNVPHIGMVVDRISPQSGRHLIVHNVGAGPKMEDVLFNWRMATTVIRAPDHCRHGADRATLSLRVSARSASLW